MIISVTILCVSVIYYHLIVNSKQTKKSNQQVKALELILEEIEIYAKEIESNKKYVEEKMEEYLLRSSVQQNKTPQLEIKKEVTPTKTKDRSKKEQIIEMHNNGCSVEEIARKLELQKGVVEVTINMANALKQA